MNETKGPSRGRKLCNCGEYIGVRVQQHSCGFSFVKKEVVEKPITPVVTKEKDVSPKITLITEKTKDGGVEANKNFDYYAPHLVTGGAGARNILLPAGKCPVDLKDFTEEGVKAWADKVAEICAESKGFLSRCALEYYSRRYYRYGVETAKEKVIRKTLGL